MNLFFQRLIGFCCLALCQSVVGQVLDPTPLAAARAGFLREVLATSRSVSEKYESALAGLEVEMAAASEYEEALLIQQRRAALKALYPSTEGEVAQSLAVPLTSSSVRLTGSAEVRAGVFTNWRTAGSSAEWAGLKINPGRYNLHLEASLIEVATPPDLLSPGRVRPQEKAAFEFYELSLLPGARESRRSFEISLNQDENTYTILQIGPLNFTRSPVTVRLTCAAGYPANIIRLRNLRLVPITTQAVSLSSPAVVQTSLDELKKSLAAELEAVQKPLVDAYLDRIRGLAAAVPQTRDAVDTETRRMIKLLENHGSQGNTPMRLLTPSSSSLNSFEDIDGARFVEDPANTGDRFLVEHEGRRLKIQLLWVQCAPVESADSSARLSGFSNHFKVTHESAIGLGRLAQEFSSGYLQGKPLRLLLRPGRNSDGYASALLFLPEVGLYQNVLVDQGLAAVVPPKERRAVSETGLLDSLIEREKTARRRNPAPGAWALSEDSK